MKGVGTTVKTRITKPAVTMTCPNEMRKNGL